jgi:hypothetical protein
MRFAGLCTEACRRKSNGQAKEEIQSSESEYVLTVNKGIQFTSHPLGRPRKIKLKLF